MYKYIYIHDKATSSKANHTIETKALITYAQVTRWQTMGQQAQILQFMDSLKLKPPKSTDSTDSCEILRSENSYDHSSGPEKVCGRSAAREVEPADIFRGLRC